MLLWSLRNKDTLVQLSSKGENGVAEQRQSPQGHSQGLEEETPTGPVCKLGLLLSTTCQHLTHPVLS